MIINLSNLAEAVEVALRVLSRRFLTILALTMVFALYSWAMVEGNLIHFLIAGAFGLTVFLPVLVQDRREVPRDATQRTDSP